MMKWNVYFENGDTQELPEKVLVYKIKSLEVTPDTLVKNEQMPDWKRLRETDIYERTTGICNETPEVSAEYDKQKRYRISFNIKMGLSLFSFMFSFLNLFAVMFIGGAEKINLSESNEDKFNVIFNVALFGSIVIFLILLYLIADSLYSPSLWFADLKGKDFFQKSHYALWKYMNTGIKLARIAFVLLCLEFVYYKLVQSGTFEPLFFSKEFFKGLEETRSSYSYWY